MHAANTLASFSSAGPQMTYGALRKTHGVPAVELARDPVRPGCFDFGAGWIGENAGSGFMSKQYARPEAVKL
jgi:hypothetical protein